jgi:CheY-like chemotaxis protein
LYAEDSPFFRSLIGGYLTSAGYDVTICNDGSEAIDLIMDDRGHERFDVIVTDIEMPKVNGWDLISAVREHEPYADVPILVVSSLSDQHSQDRASECGVAGYHVKSDRDELLNSLNKVLST